MFLRFYAPLNWRYFSFGFCTTRGNMGDMSIYCGGGTRVGRGGTTGDRARLNRVAGSSPVTSASSCFERQYRVNSRSLFRFSEIGIK